MNRRDFSAGLAVLPLSACIAEADAQSGADPAEFYACEGCEGALEPDRASLGSSASLARPGEHGEQLLIRGAVRRADGRTPAPDVVIYGYHTNPAGRYADGSGVSEASRVHGRFRGWVRTGADGRYEFRTVRPGVYPDRRGPAHVHLTVVEPGRRPYWIDSIVFQGEFGVTPAYVSRQQRRGGGGVVRLGRTDGGLLLAERNIVLERHPASR